MMLLLHFAVYNNVVVKIMISFFAILVIFYKILLYLNLHYFAIRVKSPFGLAFFALVFFFNFSEKGKPKRRKIAWCFTYSS